MTSRRKFLSDLKNTRQEDDLEAKSVRPPLRIPQDGPPQARNHSIEQLSKSLIFFKGTHRRPILGPASMTLSSHFAKSLSERASIFWADATGLSWSSFDLVRFIAYMRLFANKNATVQGDVQSSTKRKERHTLEKAKLVRKTSVDYDEQSGALYINFGDRMEADNSCHRRGCDYQVEGRQDGRPWPC